MNNQIPQNCLKPPAGGPTGGLILAKCAGECLLLPENKVQERALRQPKRSPTPSLRCSQKHPTGMFLMGSPCVPLAPARRAFQLQTAVRRLSPKDPPPLVQGAALGMGRKASFFLFLSQKERSKEKCSLRKSVSPVATGDQRHPSLWSGTWP